MTTSFTLSLSLKASLFARAAHDGQKRKYTGEDYYFHCHEVASIVRSFGGTDTMISAAYLHDTIEDTDVYDEQIFLLFGGEVRDLVVQLTNVSKTGDGNRKARKFLDLQHLQNSSPEAQTIKYADLISNTKSIVFHDTEFAEVYLKEKADLLRVLDKGNKYLYEDALAVLEFGKIYLRTQANAKAMKAPSLEESLAWFSKHAGGS